MEIVTLASSDEDEMLGGCRGVGYVWSVMERYVQSRKHISAHVVAMEFDMNNVISVISYHVFTTLHSVFQNV